MKFRKLARKFLKNKSEANFMILDGNPGMGKTDFTCLIMESLVADFDFDIITNIKFEKNAHLKHPEYERELYEKIYSKIHYASLYSSWLRATTKIKGHSVTMIDDAQSAMKSSKTIMSKKGENNSDFVRYIRKFKSNLWYVSHDPRYTPIFIYDKRPLIIFKSDVKEIQIDGETWRSVPQTKLRMDTYHSSTWDYDFDVDFIMKQLDEVPQNKRNEAILKILNGNVKDNLGPKEIMFWLLRHGYPDKTHYEIFPSWHRWKREFDNS